MAESVRKTNSGRSAGARKEGNGVPTKNRSSDALAPEKGSRGPERKSKNKLAKQREAEGPGSRPDLPETGEIRPLRPINAFEEAIEQILRLIKLGLVLPGERLLSERELALRFGVSRPTVREAIRALTQTGYLETRRGRNGGAYVVERPAAPSDSSVRRLVAEMGAEFLDALDFRLVIEPGAAALAAKRATAEDRFRLDHALLVLASAPRVDFPSSQRLENDQAVSNLVQPPDRPLSYRLADQRLHLLIAEIARAPSVAKAVGEVQVRLSDLIAHTPQVQGALRHSDEHHLRVVEAIARGDSQSAYAAMEEHVQATATFIRGFLV